ncbi:RNA polymerase sigma factor [Rhizohabitans arisaemae]|uniref:RNA polymerase sigma factor n=1 Tax=Rhizohabitans arisaemae TaxID=2720610 RepID=UPI0024B16252|nr:hypothetical protein [Rhizohabitans arisaemae]
MATSLTDHRPRRDLVAGLYDLHAGALYAYCHDQLGDPGTAAECLIAAFSHGDDAESLFAWTRKEIAERRAAPAASPLTIVNDPARALIARVVRELRPRQREVLLLHLAWNITGDALARVLDVAPDTAAELVANARSRFDKTLVVMLRSEQPGAADAVARLAQAGLGPLLARLPWPYPPRELRGRILREISAVDQAAMPAPAAPAVTVSPPAVPPAPPSSHPLPRRSPAGGDMLTGDEHPAAPPTPWDREPAAPHQARSRNPSTRHPYRRQDPDAPRLDESTQPVPEIHDADLPAAAPEGLDRVADPVRPAPPVPSSGPESGSWFTKTRPEEFGTADAAKDDDDRSWFSRFRSDDRNIDWLWEAVGLILCLGIAAMAIVYINT